MMNDLTKVAFYTLGCKLNFSETSTISRLFSTEGFRKVEIEEEPDICVINTCSVTDNADKKCRQAVKQVLKHSPKAYIAVIGCYAQLNPDEIEGIDGVDIVLGTEEKFNVVEHINKGVSKCDESGKNSHAVTFHSEITHVHQYTASYSINDRTRSFLKVQDGCDYTCSYCTIPMARGKSRSDTIGNIVRTAQEIASHGVKEIVLTGVNIGDFGKESSIVKKEVGGRKGLGSVSGYLPPAPSSKEGETRRTKDPLDASRYNIIEHNGLQNETFYELIKELDKVEGIERFRISSIEPNLLSDEIIEFVAKSKRFMPHFHIPLQSGSDKILKLMKRRYRRVLYEDRINKIKQMMPGCCVGADVIAGFPGETEEDFVETYTFLNELDISYLHVFTYSERKNTQAAEMSEIVPIKVKQMRSKMLHNLSEKKRRFFYKQYINQNAVVLFESVKKDGLIYGFTENYIKVKIPYDKSLVNALKTVQLADVDQDGVMKAKGVKK